MKERTCGGHVGGLLLLGTILAMSGNRICAARPLPDQALDNIGRTLRFSDPELSRCAPIPAVPTLDMSPKWIGSFEKNLTSFAPFYAGSVTNPSYPRALDFGPDPTLAITTTSALAPPVAVVTYPSGKSGPDSAVSFFAHPLPKGDPIGSEARLIYSVYFEPYFIWNTSASGSAVSGVLPGLVGGANASSKACVPGFDGSGATNCFAVRPVWGSGGQGGVHLSAPFSQLCSIEKNPATVTDLPAGVGGFVVGHGTWTFESDSWYKVEIYVKMNSVNDSGQPVRDGQLSVSVNGVERISFGNLVWRTNHRESVDSIHMGSYFLTDADFPANQYVLFRNFSLETPSENGTKEPASEAVAGSAATDGTGIDGAGGSVPDDNGNDNGAIAGGVIGALAVVTLAGFAAFFVVRARRRAATRTSGTKGGSPDTPPFVDAESLPAPRSTEAIMGKLRAMTGRLTPSALDIWVGIREVAASSVAAHGVARAAGPQGPAATGDTTRSHPLFDLRDDEFDLRDDDGSSEFVSADEEMDEHRG